MLPMCIIPVYIFSKSNISVVEIVRSRQKSGQLHTGISNLASKLGQIGSKWHKSEIFKISFSTFWLIELKKSQICPIWGHSDPIRMPNLISLQASEIQSVLGKVILEY